MAAIWKSITLKMFWKGYDINEPRTFLKYDLIQQITKAGDKRLVVWPADSPTTLNFESEPEYPAQIVQKFLETFHHEIFVDDRCDIKIVTLPEIECGISHELYTPMGIILSPLTKSELMGSIKHFLTAVNHGRAPTRKNFTIV